MTFSTYAKPFLVSSVLISLVGCGDDNNAYMSSSYKDIDFSKAKVIYFPDTSGTFLDEKVAKSFYSIKDADSLVGSVSSYNKDLSEMKIKMIEDIRNNLNSLPVPESIMANFESDLETAEEQAKKSGAHYAGKYTEGNIELAYRHRYPKQFAALDAIEDKIKKRTEFLGDITGKYSSLRNEVKKINDEFDKFKKRGREVAKHFFIDNQLAIPVSETYFSVSSEVSSHQYKDAADCIGHSSVRKFNAEYNVCYTTYFPYGGKNNGLSEDASELMNPEQLESYNEAVKPLQDELVVLAEKHAIQTVKLRSVSEELKKKTILADNQFGSKKALDNDRIDARRTLNRVTGGGYSTYSETGFNAPPKGKYTPAHDRVFDEYSKEVGLYGIEPLNSFNAENAYQVFKNLVKSAKEKGSEITINTEGRFKLPVKDNGNKVDGEYFISYIDANGEQKMGPLLLDYSDGEFKAGVQFPKTVNSEIDYFLNTSRYLDLHFSNGAGIQNGDSLRAYAAKLVN